MSAHRTCDSCGKTITEENPIVTKLFMVPVKQGVTAKHSSYTHHMDVGQCCFNKVHDLGWQKRKSRAAAKHSRAPLRKET